LPITTEPWNFNLSTEKLQTIHKRISGILGIPAETLVMPAQNANLGNAVQPCGRWQQAHPEPLKDEGHYDIILDDGIIKEDVEYWAFGNGFDPCNKHESKTGGHYVNYPLEYVKYYKLSKVEA
jgi:hypothetical protein